MEQSGDCAAIIMTTPTPSITTDQIITQLATFLQQFAPGADIVRAAINRASLPTDPCMVLNEISSEAIETPTATYDYINGNVIFEEPAMVGIQVDIYGEYSADVSKAIHTTFKTIWAVDQFAGTYITPLYSDTPKRVPLVTGEQQYLDRWMLVAYLQVDATITVGQGYFNTVGQIGSVPADVFYH
jgi:hypothetical protein